MKNLSLILRIVAILASAAAVTLFFISKGKLAEKQTSLEQAQAVTQATQSELETANSKITSLGTQLSTERQSLADTKGKLESIRSEMYTAKQQVTRTQQQLKETKNTIAELENTATRLRTDLVKTEESLASASKEAELAQLGERIEELAKINDTLKQDLLASAGLQQSATPEPVSNAVARGYQSGFTPSSTVAVQPATIGAATTVASISTSDGIIILDASPELGLSVGSEITLVQDLKALGKIRIIQVTEQLAVANILPGTRLRGLSKGDTIKVMH
jgi:flagellar motility protein MotE (MotC chaperone)